MAAFIIFVVYLGLLSISTGRYFPLLLPNVSYLTI